MLATVFALIVALTQPVDAGVQGRILDSGSAEPVSGAMVRLVAPGIDLVVTTSTDGTYHIGAVPPGQYRLQVHHPGYESASLRVILPAERTLVVDVPLLLRPVALAPIVVATQREPGPEGSEDFEDAEVRRATTAYSHRLSPRGGSALADMVSAEALRQPRPDPGGGHARSLYVWGSSTDRGRVLVDGAVLNAPLHMGALLPPLDPELLAAADLRSGGISTRYDGGANYILDFTTRGPSSDAPMIRGEVDPIATRLGFEAPIGKASGLLVGARRINSETVDYLLEQPFGYGYADVLARVDGDMGRHGHVRATAVLTRESIVLPRDQAEDDATWENVAVSIGWRGAERAAGTSMNASFSRGIAGLPMLSAPGGHMRATVDRLAASAEQRWSAGAAGGVVGLEFEQLRFHRFSGADPRLLDPDAFGPISCTVDLPCYGAAFANLAGYGDLSWQPTRRVSLRTGLRVGFRPLENQWDLLPRLSITTLLGQSTAWTISAGRFSQPVAMQAANLSVAAVDGRVLPAMAGVAHATHVEMGLTRRHDRVTYGATLFVRRHEEGLLGEARTIPGLDVAWGYHTEGLSLSAGYSIARGVDDADPTTAERSRHLAVGSVEATLGPMTVSLAGAYGRGLPFTSITLERATTASVAAAFSAANAAAEHSTLNAAASAYSPDLPYMRLDASIEAAWRIRKGDRTFSVVPYAKLVNALSQQDALFYFYDGLTPEPRPLARLSAVPVLGLKWAF